jgi:hypothetical protein
MVTPLDGERYLTLAEAAEVTPGRPHINTIRRWCYHGFAGIKLKSMRCGKKRIVPVAALDDFLRKTTVAYESEIEKKYGEQAETEAQLDELGA